ncbi:hypothetical protein GW17_00017606 [Ensete ventricosum]|nr:hypothetical protein GW17_00017606 [Ensete ventricosum]
MKSNGAVAGRRGLVVRARTAGASKNIEVDVDKPLGLTLGQKPGGGVVITVHQKIIIRQPHAFLFHSHRGAEVDVKRLPKRPAPPRFGRSLTESQKAS